MPTILLSLEVVPLLEERDEGGVTIRWRVTRGGLGGATFTATGGGLLASLIAWACLLRSLHLMRFLN